MNLKLKRPLCEPKFIEWAARQSLPYLPATEANEMIVRLTLENMRLQARIDAKEIGGDYE